MITAELKTALREEFEALQRDPDVLQYKRLNDINRASRLQKKEGITFQEAFSRIRNELEDLKRKTPGLRQKLERLEAIPVLLKD